VSVAVEVRDLWKSFRDGERVTEVLRGVELRAEAGEMVAIVGPSGSGKSTFLHLVGGLDRPDRGEVAIGERELSSLGRGELADFRNRTLGFVFQFHQLLPDFDAVENVAMPLRIAGWSARRAAQRSRELLERVALGHRLDHFPAQLSGGERQRVALCRALVLEPPLLLADEPTGNLDPASGEVVLELLLELRRELGVTAILVTHNPEVAERCGRVLTLNGGVIEPSPPPSHAP
jgi:lipoprotein-releasing system ATP-binding protein